MPELPEVQTTVSGLRKVLPGLFIRDIWTDWQKMVRHQKFSDFRKQVVGKKFLTVGRRAKNVLIDVSGGKTIVIHMKMTGHLLYGKYERSGKTWVPAKSEKNDGLRDPYNRFIHFVFILSNSKHLAFSDTRKFGKVALADTKTISNSPLLSHLGPEPLSKNFTLKIFREGLLRRKKTKIKTALMDQTVISGIGNIYSDEILWRAGVHPERKVGNLSQNAFMAIFRVLKPTLRRGVNLGGDSMSDYRNIFGKRGRFQNTHRAYRKTGEPCSRPKCYGTIVRKVINGRSAHFCKAHQR